MFGYVTVCEPELKVKDLKKYRAYYSMAVSFIGIAAIIKLALNHLKLVLSVYSFTFLSPFSHSHC